MDLDLHQLRALDAAVSEGTLEAAARVLRVTPSAVSQRLRALEVATGRILLVRSKPVRPTAAGEAVLRLARQVALLTDDAARALAGEVGGRSTLAVAVNADSLATWVLPAIAPLADVLSLHLLREDERRTEALLRSGEVLAAITTRAEPVAGCTVRPLGAMRYRPVASPAFIARWFADGPTGEALAVAPVVVFDRDDPLQHDYLIRRGVTADPPTHMVPASADCAAAIGLGMGWGMLPALQAGAGSEVFDADGGVDVPLYLQRWRLSSPALDRLTDALVEAGRSALM